VSILPAPLVSAGELVGTAPGSARPLVGIAADSAGRLITPEVERPPPKVAAVDEPLPRDQLTAKDGLGLTLSAEFQWDEVPRAALPEMDSASIEAARKEAELRVRIDLAYVGRMRLALASASFPLPPGTELRAREDRYGHVLVWPSGTMYRVLAPGSLRAMFGERRGDVTPLMRGQVQPAGQGRLLEQETQRKVATTSLGKLTIEQAEVVGAGSAGGLLCRMLVELVAMDPSTPLCADDTVPLSAQYEWDGGGRLGFIVSTMENRQDLLVTDISVPPPAAEFRQGELPPETDGVLLTREQLARFRRRPLPPSEPAKAGAPGEGMTAVNHEDTLRYVLLDGVPIAWVRAHQERYVIGPRAGRYSIAWRDFFGKRVQAPEVLTLPARVSLGKADSVASAP
jgi:hypothetical protein